IIDDTKGVTLAYAASFSSSIRKIEGDKKAKAQAAGLELAKKAQAAKIKKIVFDTGGNKYHGRVAALADGAREGGLEF
ncbi:MAG: 50S ribosomal protein L18, partial [Bifidobacteriaceae bacterium]|nr:50S ribosomal protein L18 [Bifidobacteriaceae bacterium]